MVGKLTNPEGVTLGDSMLNDRSFYVPKAFYINFRYGLLDDQGMPKIKEMPIFLHEYAHLIVDQTTIFGIVRFINQLDRFQELRRLLMSNCYPQLPMRNATITANSWGRFLDVEGI